jgi:hypothetical protein
MSSPLALARDFVTRVTLPPASLGEAGVGEKHPATPRLLEPPLTRLRPRSLQGYPSDTYGVDVSPGENDTLIAHMAERRTIVLRPDPSCISAPRLACVG